MEWRAAVRFQKYFSMVGELNVWWPATRVSLLLQSSHSSVWRKAAFHMLVKMAGNLGVCSSAFLRPLSQKRQTSPRATICRSLHVFSSCSIQFNSICVCAYKLGIFSSTICTFCLSTFLECKWNRKLNYYCACRCVFKNLDRTKVSNVYSIYTETFRIVPIKFVFFQIPFVIKFCIRIGQVKLDSTQWSYRLKIQLRTSPSRVDGR